MPTWIVITCRRYLCTICGAILMVVPRGVAPHRHYGHAAIAMALTLWAIAHEPDRTREGSLLTVNSKRWVDPT